MGCTFVSCGVLLKNHLFAFAYRELGRWPRSKIALSLSYTIHTFFDFHDKVKLEILGRSHRTPQFYLRPLVNATVAYKMPATGFIL
jgi:hypothetical protein